MQTAMRSILIGGGVLTTTLLLAASWIDPAYWAATWLGLSLLFLIAVSLTPGKAFLAGGIAAAGALGIAFYWAPEVLRQTLDLTHWVAWAAFAVMIGYEAIPVGIVAMLGSRWLAVSALRMWGIGVVWVALEVSWPRVFSWSFAHSQTDFLPLLQMGEVLGAPGISFVMISVAVIPAACLRRAIRRRAGILSIPVLAYSGAACSLLAAALIYGYSSQHAWEEYAASKPVLRTTLVQIDPNYVDSIDKMRERSLSPGADVELVCWPESTLGNYCSTLTGFGNQDVTLAKSLPPMVDMQPTLGIGCDVLAGGRLFEPGARDEGPFFQTGFLIYPDQTIAGRYLKRTLMPIGEYIPGETYFPALRRMADLQDLVVTGNAASPLELRNGAKVGVLMCYDDMVPANARKSVAEGAQVLVTLANGSAFSNPLALEQHMRLALLRAVENRRYFARCGATGVSCIIAPTGAITHRLDTEVEASLTADLPLLDGRTAYNRFGFLFGPTCMAIAGFWLLLTSWSASRRRRRRTGRDGSAQGANSGRRVRVANGSLADSPFSQREPQDVV